MKRLYTVITQLEGVVNLLVVNGRVSETDREYKRFVGWNEQRFQRHCEKAKVKYFHEAVSDNKLVYVHYPGCKPMRHHRNVVGTDVFCKDCDQYVPNVRNPKYGYGECVKFDTVTNPNNFHVCGDWKGKSDVTSD